MQEEHSVGLSSVEQKKVRNCILEISVSIPLCYQSILLEDHLRSAEFKQIKHS